MSTEDTVEAASFGAEEDTDADAEGDADADDKLEEAKVDG